MHNKQKHLEFIQEIISRMANNSFLLKGWGITLVAALFALSAKDTNSAYIIFAYFPAVVFWILDGYFLSQERLFRSLYDYVRILKEEKIDFSMNTSKFKKEERNGWISSMFSNTLLIFYLPLLAVMLIVIYLIK
jgi:hypothetical protein